MKEFGVKFEGYDVNDRKRTYWSFEEYEFSGYDIAGLMKDFKRFAKYKTYVCKESESIFEPKNDDIGQYFKMNNTIALSQFQDGKWLDYHHARNVSEEPLETFTIKNSKIIMRFATQFFAPLIGK